MQTAYKETRYLHPAIYAVWSLALLTSMSTAAALLYGLDAPKQAAALALFSTALILLGSIYGRVVITVNETHLAIQLGLLRLPRIRVNLASVKSARVSLSASAVSILGLEYRYTNASKSGFLTRSRQGLIIRTDRSKLFVHASDPERLKRAILRVDSLPEIVPEYLRFGRIASTQRVRPRHRRWSLLADEAMVAQDSTS